MEAAIVVVLAKTPRPTRDLLGAGVGIRPEHDRRHAELADRFERLGDLPLAVAVLRRDGVLRDDQERLREVERPADAPLEDVAEPVRAVHEHVFHEVHARAADRVDRVEILAHALDAPRCVGARREVNVRELRHRMADALVDVAGDLPAHRVRERDVHVGRGECRRHRLEPVPDGEDDVGLEPLERSWQLEQPETRRLCHRARRLALDQHVDALRGLETIALDYVEDGSIPVEQRRRADDELELEPGMVRDRTQRRLDARVVRPRADDDADLAHHPPSQSMSTSCNTWSAAIRVRARRPTISWSRRAGIPVPGFFTASISAVSVAPTAISLRATTLFSKTCFIWRKGSTSSLSTGAASIDSIS